MIALKVVTAGGPTVVGVPAAPGVLIVGSGPTAGLRLDDPGVDPEHLSVEMTPAGARVTDRASRTGTRLGGMLVSQAIVRAGDEIRIGNTTLSVVEDAGARAPVAAVAPPAPPPAPAPASPRFTAPPAKPKPPVRAAAPKRRPEAAPARPAQRSEPVAPPPRPVAPPPRTNGGENGGRATRAAPRKKGRNYWLFGVVPLIAILFGLFYSMHRAEQSRIRECEDAFNRGAAAWAEDRHDDARRAFNLVIERWPDLPASDRAKTSLAELEAELVRERESRARRAELEEQWTQLTLVEFEKDYRAYRSEYLGTAAADDDTFIAGIRKRYAEEGARRFKAVKARAEELLRENRYYDAILAWHEYISIPQNVVPDVKSATDEFDRIQLKARASFEAVRGEVEGLVAAGKLDEAAALLDSRTDEFRGTRYLYDLRQKRELVAVLELGGEVPPEVVEEKVTERREYLALVQEAESLVERRRYADAVAAYRKAAEACPREDQAAELRARADDLTGTARLFAELASQLRTHPERFRGIDLGHGLLANGVRTDDEGLTVSIRGAESRLPWSRLGPARLLVVLARLKLPPADQLHLARFAFGAGDEDAGHAALTAAIQGDESLAEEGFAILARARKIAVPAGGFVLYKRRWLTPTERDEAELKDAIADAAREAKSSDRRRSDAGLKKLRGYGAPAVSALVEVLGVLRRSTVEELKAHPAVRDPALKTVLYRELEERRKAALALIYDEAKYPYPHPDGPEYDAVQAEVDALVEQVRIVWERPLARLLERNPEVLALYDRLESLSLELSALGREPDPSFDTLVAEINAAIDMPGYAPGGTEKSAKEWNDKVMAYNEQLPFEVDAEELKCVRTLNRYRMMMGRRAVKINEKLLDCARAHSKEMKTEGYFAHDCPLPGPEHDRHRRPGQRAQIAGYGGGVSENIAMGSEDGEATHWQWYRSSGHHRNLLGKGHTEVGVGREGNYWTQNFGSASKTVELPRRPRPPAGE